MSLGIGKFIHLGVSFKLFMCLWLLLLFCWLWFKINWTGSIIPAINVWLKTLYSLLINLGLHYSWYTSILPASCNIFIQPIANPSSNSNSHQIDNNINLWLHFKRIVNILYNPFKGNRVETSATNRQRFHNQSCTINGIHLGSA